MLLRRTGTPNPTHEHADLSPPCPQLWGGEYVGLLDEQRPHHVPAPRSAGIVPGLIGRGTRLGNGRASPLLGRHQRRSEEHTSELQSLMRISYAVICLKKKTTLPY